MSDYIINAIVTGVWETFQMTFFASLFSYAVGMPLGILLYATSRGRLLENRPVNFIIGLVVNITRSLPFLILLVLLIPFTSRAGPWRGCWRTVCWSARRASSRRQLRWAHHRSIRYCISLSPRRPLRSCRAARSTWRPSSDTQRWQASSEAADSAR